MPVINFSAMGFYGRNRGNYRKLWEILGREWTSLAVEATWSAQTRERPRPTKVDLTEAQRHALLPVLTSMGLFRALSLQPYAELELTGAKFKSMVARVTDIRETYLEPRDGEGRSKYRFGRIVCQFGQRPRTDWQDGTVEQIKENLSAKVLAHQWVNQELAKFGEDPFYGPFATEFELGILAFIVAFDGAVEVGTYVGATDTVSLSGVPLRAVENCDTTGRNASPGDQLACSRTSARRSAADHRQQYRVSANALSTGGGWHYRRRHQCATRTASHAQFRTARAHTLPARYGVRHFTFGVRSNGRSEQRAGRSSLAT